MTCREDSTELRSAVPRIVEFGVQDIAEPAGVERAEIAGQGHAAAIVAILARCASAVPAR
jgi:hypothetical protein